MTSAIFDFTGDVTLTQLDLVEPRAARVMVGQDRIVFVMDELKQTVALADVFDVTRDVARGTLPDTPETVSIAFEVGGTREVATIHARADTLVWFQGALYGQLLDDMQCVVSHEPNRDSNERSRGRFTLEVTASRIRFKPEAEADPEITVLRDEIFEFRALENTVGDRNSPEVLLVSRDDDEVTRTTVCLPSTRHRNLFGRYLKSELRLTDHPDPDEPTTPDSIELLLVDDDPQDLHATEMFLKQRPEPYSIELAPGVDSGLGVIEDQGADCVVSDFRMPRTDGIEFLRIARERFPNLPFILYTGKGNERVAKRAILDDVTDYVEKGIGTEQYDILAERINKAIQRPARRQRT